MNKIVIIAVFIFWAIVSFFFVRSLFDKQPEVLLNSTNSQLPAEDATGQAFSVDLVAQHNTAADCWVTYGNTVYNVTDYLNSHPGGRDRIIPYCGSDIAAAFAAQGHSNTATSILNGLAIGTIGQIISNDPNTITPPPVSNPKKDDDDDEKEDDD